MNGRRKSGVAAKSFFTVPLRSASSLKQNNGFHNGSGSGFHSPARPGWVGLVTDPEEPAAPALERFERSAASSRRHSSSEDAEDAPKSTSTRRQTIVPAEDRVKVVVRLRPAQAGETGGAMQVSDDGKDIQLLRNKMSVPTSEFYFDEVLRPNASQADVYDAAVAPVVDDVMRGYNGTVMAYGQTGAGKTFTLGSLQPENIGMMPRAAAAIFMGVDSDPTHHYTVHMSYLQIYNELLQDLLNPRVGDLSLRESAEEGVHIPGLKEVLVTRLEDCLELLKLGERNRTYAFTRLNAQSSRSHAIVVLTVAKRLVIDPSVQGIEAVSMKANVGRLFMVDLAGSERLKKSMSVGMRASEAKAINLSLTVLGMCINARAAHNPSHVPYRDSKLTRLLKESLGGNARTTLVVAVADALEHCDESLQSLQFGMRAMFVENEAVVNEKTDDAATHQQLMEEMAAQANKADALNRSLIAKQSALGVLENKLEREQQERQDIMGALERERGAAIEGKRLAEQQHRAALQAERSRQDALAQRLTQTQAETQQLETIHKEERAMLEAALEERIAALHALHQTAAEAESARVELQNHADELQVRLQMEQEGSFKKTAEDSAALEQQLADMTAQLADVTAQLAAAQATGAAAKNDYAAQVAAAKAAMAAAEQKLEAQIQFSTETATKQEDAHLARLKAATKTAEARVDKAQKIARADVAAARRELENLKASQGEQIAERLSELTHEADSIRQAAAADASDMAEQAAALRTSHAGEIEELKAKLSTTQTAATSAAAERNALQVKLTAERSASTKQAAALQAEMSRVQSQLEELRTAAAADARSAALQLETAESAVIAERAAAAEKLRAISEQVSVMRATQARLQSQLEAKTVELKHAGTASAAAASTAASERAWLQSQLSDLQAASREAAGAAATNVASLETAVQHSASEKERLLKDLQMQTDALSTSEERLSVVEEQSSVDLRQHNAQAAELKAEVDMLQAILSEQKAVMEGNQEMHAAEAADLKAQLLQAQSKLEDASTQNADSITTLQQQLADFTAQVQAAKVATVAAKNAFAAQLAAAKAATAEAQSELQAQTRSSKAAAAKQKEAHAADLIAAVNTAELRIEQVLENAEANAQSAAAATKEQLEAQAESSLGAIAKQAEAHATELTAAASEAELRVEQVLKTGEAESEAARCKLDSLLVDHGEQLAKLQQEVDEMRLTAAANASEMLQQAAALRSKHAAEVEELDTKLSSAESAAKSAAALIDALETKLTEECYASSEQAAALCTDVSRLQSQLEELRTVATTDAAAAALRLEAATTAAASERSRTAEKLADRSEQISAMQAVQDKLLTQFDLKAAELVQAGAAATSAASTAASERAWLQSQLSDLQTASRQAAAAAAKNTTSLETAAQQSALEHEQLCKELQLRTEALSSTKEQLSSLGKKSLSDTKQLEAQAAAFRSEVSILQASLADQNARMERCQEVHAAEAADLQEQLSEAQGFNDAMAEEMAEVREETAEVISQRDAAEAEAQQLTAELERLQAEFDDDSAALQARLETMQTQTSAAKYEAALALKQKDTMLQHQRNEASHAEKAANISKEKAAADIAGIEQLLAESRVTVQWLEIEGDKVRQQGIITADKLTASNDMLRGAVQALTREYNASCTAESAVQEQLCQLQSAHGALHAQAGKAHTEAQRQKGRAEALEKRLQDVEEELHMTNNDAKSAAQEAKCQQMNVERSTIEIAKLQEALDVQRREGAAEQQKAAGAAKDHVAASAAAKIAHQKTRLEVRQYRGAAEAAATELASLRQLLAATESRAAAAEAAGAAHASAAKQHAVRTAAATTLQRRFRARRAAQHASEFAAHRQVLEEVQAEREALQRRQAAEAAASGHKDFASSLLLMQDAVDLVLSEFLLPERQLRAARAARTQPADHISAVGHSSVISRSSAAASSGVLMTPLFALHPVDAPLGMARCASGGLGAISAGSHHNVVATTTGTPRNVSPPASPTASHASSHTSVKVASQDSLSQPRSSLGSAMSHLAIPTDSERLSPLESACRSSRSKQRNVQEAQKTIAGSRAEADSPPRSLPSLPHALAPVSQGPLASSYRASRYQRPELLHDVATGAGVLREVQHVRAVSSAKPVAATPNQPRSLRSRGEAVDSVILSTTKPAKDQSCRYSKTILEAPRPGVGQPLSPVQSEDEGTHGSVRRSDHSSDFGSPDTSQASADSVGRNIAIEEGRHQSGLLLPSQDALSSSSSLGESVMLAATKPPKQPATDRRGRSLFNPEASVFVSQFVGDAAQSSPTRNATWSRRRLTKPREPDEQITVVELHHRQQVTEQPVAPLRLLDANAPAIPPSNTFAPRFSASRDGPL